MSYFLLSEYNEIIPDPDLVLEHKETETKAESKLILKRSIFGQIYSLLTTLFKSLLDYIHSMRKILSFFNLFFEIDYLNKNRTQDRHY